MEQIPVLRDLVVLVVLVAIAIPAVLLAHRLKIPTLVGFLFTGIVIGPHALGFVSDHYELRRQRGTSMTRVDGFLSPVADALASAANVFREGSKTGEVAAIGD